jgi:hypothetical protein
MSQRETILERLDPEAAALLVEIAARPSSLLLSAERVSLDDPSGRSPGFLTPQTPGLTRAERQLLAVHRRDLGLLLHELAAGLIWEADRFQDLMLGAHGPRGDQRPQAPAVVFERLQGPLDPALDALNLPPHGHSLTARIQALLQGLARPSPEPTDTPIRTSLALANLLLPSVWTQVNRGFYLCRRGQPRLAESILASLDPKSLDREGARAMWEANLANSRLQQGRFSEAAYGYMRSFSLRPHPVILRGCWTSAVLAQEWELLGQLADEARLRDSLAEPRLSRIFGMLDSRQPNWGGPEKIREASKKANRRIRTHVEAVLDAEPTA